MRSRFVKIDNYLARIMIEIEHTEGLVLIKVRSQYDYNHSGKV